MLKASHKINYISSVRSKTFLFLREKCEIMFILLVYNMGFPALTGILALALYIHNAILSILATNKKPENNVSTEKFSCFHKYLVCGICSWTLIKKNCHVRIYYYFLLLHVPMTSYRHSQFTLPHY